MSGGAGIVPRLSDPSACHGAAALEALEAMSPPKRSGKLKRIQEDGPKEVEKADPAASDGGQDGVVMEVV